MKRSGMLGLVLTVFLFLSGCDLPPGATPYHSPFYYESYPDFYGSYPFYDPFFDDPFYSPFYNPNSFSFGYYYYPHHWHRW